MAPILLSVLMETSAFTAGVSTAQAEKAYWDCEFKAIQSLLNPHEADSCSAIYEQLKRDKFFGDFSLFHDWWRQQKDHEISSRRTPRALQRAPTDIYK